MNLHTDLQTEMPTNGSAAREAGWVSRLFHREAYTQEYQQLKFSLHNKLLNRINLEALSSIPSDRAREPRPSTRFTGTPCLL